MDHKKRGSRDDDIGGQLRGATPASSAASSASEGNAPAGTSETAHAAARADGRRAAAGAAYYGYNHSIPSQITLEGKAPTIKKAPITGAFSFFYMYISICLPVHGDQELFVVAGAAHVLQHEVHRFLRIHVRQVIAQDINALQHFFFQ
jgi:hypothetical protein